MLRAIHAIFDTSDLPCIEAFRQRFDPLFPHIQAHLTVVFRFDLPVSDEALLAHGQTCTEGLRAFSMELQRAECSTDDHFWLSVRPSPTLEELTRRLHEGPLAPLAVRQFGATPHITLARPPLPPDLQEEFLKLSLHFPFSRTITSILLEAIEPEGGSLELGRFSLPE